MTPSAFAKLFARTATGLVLAWLPVAPLAGSPPARLCRDAVLAEAPEAERVCSHAIDGLVAGADPDPATRLALAGAYNNRAVARMAAGDLAGAAGDLQQATELAPENAAFLLNRGNLSLWSGDPQAAITGYAAAGAGSPAIRRAMLRNLVLAYRALGDPLQAEKALLMRLAEPAPAVAVQPNAEPEPEPGLNRPPPGAAEAPWEPANPPR